MKCLLVKTVQNFKFWKHYYEIAIYWIVLPCNVLDI